MSRINTHFYVGRGGGSLRRMLDNADAVRGANGEEWKDEINEPITQMRCGAEPKGMLPDWCDDHLVRAGVDRISVAKNNHFSS